MSISAISSSAAAYQPNPQDPARQDFLQLVKSIKSGDLTGAQQAYTALTQAQSASGVQPDPDSPLAKALSDIGQALQSGDISGAQQTLASLQKAVRGGHHHRHHHPAPEAIDQATNATAITPPADTSSTNSTINITA